MDRREFLASAAAMGAVLAWPAGAAWASKRRWHERRDLFPLGVASGDPTADSVILWTRREAQVPLAVEIALDESFTRTVATETIVPREYNDWTVRVLAGGLKPATTYYYRFVDAKGRGSRVGRTRTAPGPDDARAVNFAFASCQNENLGANNAYRRMIFEDRKKPADEQLDFVLHLGDFIYELVWYPEDRATYYARKVREVVRYPTGEKHDNYHVPVDVADYRAIWRAYLSDPDLMEARARFPFVCVWDNHEFSWRGWQSFEDYGQGAFPAQTRKAAAAKAWFEYQPARVLLPGRVDYNVFEMPRIADRPMERIGISGLALERNNLLAIQRLRMFRALRFGRNVELILTDNRSFRTRPVDDQPEADALGDENFPSVFPLDALEILDAGGPQETIKFGGKDIPNWRKGQPAQTMLGQKQKDWFLGTLAKSQATWKVWGNSVGTLDGRIDYKNQSIAPWPGGGFATLTSGDWAGYRTERAEIFDHVKTHGVTGFAIVAGDRHSFWAGLASKALPPDAFEPVGVEFITGSISAPGAAEAYESRMPKTHPFHALYANINVTTRRGVQAGLDPAHGKSNAELAPHLSFIDWGGHGYTVVRAASDALTAEFVCIPRPIERAASDDGGPLRYRVRHRAALWKAGEAPRLEQTVVEGDVGDSA